MGGDQSVRSINSGAGMARSSSGSASGGGSERRRGGSRLEGMDPDLAETAEGAQQ